MFSHGSCGYPNQSTFLTALLASHGFVVVAPPHPGNTIYEIARCGTAPALAAAFVERPQDILFVLDGMLAADADPGSPFFGAIDDTRILFEIGAAVANATKWPEWKSGTEFKTRREAMLRNVQR